MLANRLYLLALSLCGALFFLGSGSLLGCGEFAFAESSNSRSQTPSKDALDNYLETITRKLQQEWHPPATCRWFENRTIESSVQFLIYPDGSIRILDLKKWSIDPTFDRELLCLIVSSSPLERPPIDSSSVIEVVFTCSGRAVSATHRTIKIEKLRSEAESTISQAASKGSTAAENAGVKLERLAKAYYHDPTCPGLEAAIVQALQQVGVDTESKKSVKAAGEFFVGHASLDLCHDSDGSTQAAIGLLSFGKRRFGGRIFTVGLLDSYAKKIALSALKALPARHEPRDGLEMLSMGKAYELADQLDLARACYDQACEQGSHSLVTTSELIGLAARMDMSKVLYESSSRKLDGELIPKNPTSSAIEKVLWWLPEDTEVLNVVCGPLKFPESTMNEMHFRSLNGIDESKYLFDEDLALHMMLSPDFLHMSHLSVDKTISITASRHFTMPTNLGVGVFEGAQITVFDTRNKVDSAALFLSGFMKHAQRTFTINGIRVYEDHKKCENDHWKSFICSPAKGVLVVATNRVFLEELLARAQRKHSLRALSESLPVWKYVDKNANIWAIRNYDSPNAVFDFSSPLFLGRGQILRDKEAKGLAFDYRIGQKYARLTYLSSSKPALKEVEHYWQSVSESLVIERTLSLYGSALQLKLRKDPYVSFVLLGWLGQICCL